MILGSYLGTSDYTPVNTLWVDNYSRTITSQMTINSLRSGTLSFREERCGFSQNELGTHCIRSGFAMEFFQERLYPETIKRIGRLSSNTFFIYVRLQVRNLRKGISDIIISTKIFYTIPETEIIYYTPGEEENHSHMIRKH